MIKRWLAAAMAALLLLCCSQLTTADHSAAVRVGIAWSADFKAGVPDGNTQIYIDAITKAGGEAVYLHQAYDEESALAILQTVDCLVFKGGEDISPSYYGETPSAKLESVNDARDLSDYWLAKVALDIHMPILATCRGLQLVNIVCGGTLYQDIGSQCDTNIHHRDPAKKKYMIHSSAVSLPDSLMAEAMGGVGIYHVNSWHHQAVKDVGEGLIVTAFTKDGLVEALESTNPNQFLLAVQFHPERHIHDGDETFLSFFRMLIDAAEQADWAA